METIVPDIDRPSGMTAQEYVYQRMRQSLITGSMPPGLAVTIRGLADMLGVSPTPVREALKRLSSEQALEVLENRRIVVPRITAERFEELVALRAAIETHAIARAMPYMSELLIDRLELLDGQLDAALAVGNLELQIVLNQQFHSELHSINPHYVSAPVLESIWLQLGPFMRIASSQIKGLMLVDRHKEAIAALRLRDPAAVQSAISADIHDSAACLYAAGVDNILDANLNATMAS